MTKAKEPKQADSPGFDQAYQVGLRRLQRKNAAVQRNYHGNERRDGIVQGLRALNFQNQEGMISTFGDQMNDKGVPRVEWYRKVPIAIPDVKSLEFRVSPTMRTKIKERYSQKITPELVAELAEH